MRRWCTSNVFHRPGGPRGCVSCLADNPFQKLAPIKFQSPSNHKSVRESGTDGGSGFCLFTETKHTSK